MGMTAETLASLEEQIPAWVDGKLTPVGKLEVHQKGLRHKAVSVFVVDGPRVLIQRRAAGKYHTPLLWANTCCTHPRWDEDPAACASRRLAEELGITDVTPVFADQVEYRADVGGGLTEHELVDIFVAEAGPDLAMDLNPDEVAEVRWVDLVDLADEVKHDPDRFTPWVRIYITDHVDRIFGTGARHGG